MSTFNRLPGESFLDYLWRNFGGKVVQGESNIILTDDKVTEVVQRGKAELLQELPEIIEDQVAELIQEKIVGDSGTIIINTDGEKISAKVKIDESESPVSLSVSENGLKASLEIDADSSVELSTDSGKLRADIPLRGSDHPLTFEKITSENYSKLDTIEYGKIYLITDAPIFYLDGVAYGATDALTTGLIKSIRYSNGYIYYTVVGSAQEKQVKIDEVSETNPGLMTSEELRLLNELIKILAGIDNILEYVDSQISEISAYCSDNTLYLSYLDKVISETALPEDKYLSSVVKRIADKTDVQFANSSGLSIKEGDVIVVLSVENGGDFIIPIGEVITELLLSTFLDSNTISFSSLEGRTSAEVRLDDSDSNLLSVSNKGLTLDLTFDAGLNLLDIYGIDKNNPIKSLNILTPDSISEDAGNLLRINNKGELIAELNWGGDTENGLAVTFDYGNKLDYEEGIPGRIFFATDTKELFFNDICYSLTSEEQLLLESIKDSAIKIEYQEESLVITTASGDTYSVILPIATAISEESSGTSGLMSAELATKLEKLKIVNAGKGLNYSNEKFNISLSDDDKILSITDSNDLTATVNLIYEDNKIKLLGRDAEVISELTLQSLKDGVINNISLSRTDDKGTEGFFIVFTWSADAFDSDEPVTKYINLEELILDPIDLVLSIINGVDEEGNPKEVYTSTNSIADDILGIKILLEGIGDIIDAIKNGKLVKDVLVNGKSVVTNFEAIIDLTADAVVFEESLDGDIISVKDLINFINGDVDTEGSIRYDASKYVDNSWEWEEISIN